MYRCILIVVGVSLCICLRICICIGRCRCTYMCLCFANVHVFFGGAPTLNKKMQACYRNTYFCKLFPKQSLGIWGSYLFFASFTVGCQTAPPDRCWPSGELPAEVILRCPGAVCCKQIYNFLPPCLPACLPAAVHA